jgi:hypothetical protein
MSTLSRFKGSAATTALCLVIPTFLWSQVIIKERVEIKPKQPNASLPAKTSSLSLDYFNPPLFIEQSGSASIPLPSTLTISGQVDILGAIGGNQYAKIVLTLNPSLEQVIAWKGRDPIPWGGNMYEGQSPYTGVFDKGGAPSLYMLTFDGQFGTGAKQISITEAGLSWTFSSYLNQGSFPRVDVTGSAIAMGSVIPEWRFSSWWIETYPSSLSCGQMSRIDFLPLDGANRLYEPHGISRSEAFVTLNVDAKGDYVYLRCGDQEGKEITISLADASDARLVLDTSRGEIDGERDTAKVTLTGGGKTAETLVPLFCEKLHHFRIIADPLEVEHGSGSKLTVIAEDINDQEVVLDQDPELTFWLSSPHIIIGSVRDTGGTGGKRLPGKMLMKTTDRRRDPKLADDTPLYGSFTVDGGPPQPDYITAQYSVARQGKVEYLADGQIPYGDSPEPVVITAEKTEDWTKSGSVELLVGPSICAQVTFDPPTIAPGDTAQLSFKKINDDGTLEDFPSDQLFNVGILSGDGDRGVLVSASGEIGTTLGRAPVPIRYVAPESIEGDTLIVSVIATAAFSSGSSAASVKSTGKHAMPSAKSTAARLDSALIQTQKKAELESVRAKLIAQATGLCPLSQLAVIAPRIKDFWVGVVPDTIKFGTRGKIQVLARNQDEQEIEPPAAMSVNVVLAQNERFGSLVYRETVAKQAENVPYSDAHNAKVLLAADGENPVGLQPQKVQVGVTKVGEETVYGLGNAYVRCVLDPPRYSQGRGSPWGDQYYANSQAKIADLGCALSCLSIVMTAFGDTVNPGQLNDWMKQKDKTNGGFDGLSITWNAMIFHSKGKKIDRTEPVNTESSFDLSAFDPHLVKCDLILAKVFNSESVKKLSVEDQEKKKKEGNHWVVITGKDGDSYSIIDPGRGLTRLSDYGRIYRYVIAKKK